MNCLRCGRTVPEQVLFCPECAGHDRKKPAKAPEATFVNTEEQAHAAARKLRRKNRRLRRWVAAMTLFALLMTGLLSYSIVTAAKWRSQLAVQIARANSLQTALGELQDELSSANTLLNSMQNIISQYQTLTGLSPDEVA